MAKDTVVKKVNDLQVKLRSEDEKIVVKAIKQVKKDGNKDIVLLMLNLLSDPVSENVKKEI